MPDTWHFICGTHDLLEVFLSFCVFERALWSFPLAFSLRMIFFFLFSFLLFLCFALDGLFLVVCLIDIGIGMAFWSFSTVMLLDFVLAL
ncbi:Uncharacterized protein TCM_041893 [Theobroma cacao]|uniref:Uncharacterized protein n=1 Tax=Theobroma cacao TaxID=3641 RepID=A0A061GW90_THECC|nr:Uncharacterized protein TCM_041893 [Theobroma cacao]